MKFIGSIKLCILSSFTIYWGVYAGFACLSNPCMHGVCMDGLNTSYSCYCIDGYTGVQCQTNWDECWSSPCLNGGVCYDGIASFNCSCPAGFVGEVCQEDFNECESNPCLNNGTCFDITNGYTCNCLPGYLGTYCEIDISVCDSTNETRCANGGVCVEGPGESFSCECPAGWNGFLCDHEIDECMSSPCQHGAVCIDLHADYSCACTFGFTGRNCDDVIMVCEDNPCRNDALCLMEAGHPMCYCVPDFHGEWCQYQYDECQLGPRCMNGGSCIDGIDTFTCSCPPKLTGLYCECLILEDNSLDCTYIKPTIIDFTTTEIPITFTTTSTVFTEMPNSTTNLIDLTNFTQTESSTKSSSESTFSTFSTESTFITSIPTETPISLSTISNTTSTLTERSTTKLFSTEITTILNVTETDTTYFQLDTTTMGKDGMTSIGDHEETSSEFVPITSTVFSTFPGRVTVTDLVETTSYGKTSTFLLSTFLTDEPSYVTESGLSETEITTIGHEITTTFKPFLDCTKSENKCLNGGTCTFVMDGYKCVCPFDTDGLLCEKHLGIRNAAFNGKSFLTHRLFNQSQASISFKVKTLATSGLIFYTNIENSYIALYLEEGHLKFKFSCGFQTMLLSEVEVPVNNGYDMDIKTELKFSKDNKHCEAFININDTLIMSGDQIALMDPFAKKNLLVHFGGIPENSQIDGFGYEGFIGCIRKLEISGKEMLIFKDADDGVGVTECSSLACLSNPCGNGASCSAKGDDWYCHCKNGFVGKMCETSICDNNPCQYGATCLPFTGSGYICLCPFGKHGHFCESDLEITKPYFSSSIYGYSSFIAYPLPTAVSNKLEIKFRFSPATMDQISILMFLGQRGQHNFHSDHMAVSFVKGYIMLTWNLGSGPRRIFTSKPINAEMGSHLIHIGRIGRRAWLFVENLGNITGRSPGNLVQLDVVPILYLGGHDSKNFTSLPHDLPLHSGFAGCIYDVEFKSGGFVIPLAESKYAFGRALGQCGTTECYEKICQNGGACLYHGGTFTCLCQDSFFGPMCSTKYNPCNTLRSNCWMESSCVPLIAEYECDCPLGRTGKFCQNETIISDVGFSGIRSYLTLDPVVFELIKFNIDFELRPLSDRGLVLFIGKRDFISIFLHGSVLEIRLLPSRHRILTSDLISLRSNKLLVLGNWHKINVGMYGRKTYLFVDGIVTTAILNNGDLLNLSGETIYLGGLPDLSILPNEATISYPIPFMGCIRNFFINSQRIPLTSTTIKSSRNIVDCDGTPCGGDYCENNGSCWLDPNLNPHCSCPDPYYGEKCEEIPSCEEKHCENNGKCLENRCACTIGYSGAFCETTISVKTPMFSKNSYIIISKGLDKKRDLNSFSTNFYLNFTTVSQNGLILWTEKSQSYLGIGIENGHLKIVYSIGNYDEILQVLDFPKISDGLWHSLEVNFEPFILKLDQKEINIEIEHYNGTLNVDDKVFYLGGLPKEISQKYQGIFANYFEGCIIEFGYGKDVNIKDFSKYKGENIEMCNLV
nr:protein eyes shut [Onthophagus taurus]XP_022918882.1 protein eyes shut [Onthophagus taurus]XP_022918883.1 protein eyes shut [Onthophagus taurus]